MLSLMAPKNCVQINDQKLRWLWVIPVIRFSSFGDLVDSELVLHISATKLARMCQACQKMLLCFADRKQLGSYLVLCQR